jgi:hypothetical protein
LVLHAAIAQACSYRGLVEWHVLMCGCLQTINSASAQHDGNMEA